MSTDENLCVDQAITEINKNGYTILRGFVDQQGVEDLKRLADKYFKPLGMEARRAAAARDYSYSEFDSKEAARKSLLVQTREVDDLVTDQRVLSIAEAVLLEGPPYYRRVRTAGTGFKDAYTRERDVRSLHRDDAIYPVRIPGKPLVLNTLLAIDEFTPESGSTTFVPGSHLWDKPVDPDHETVAIEMDPGDLALFGGEVWHGHGQNKTNGRQRCLAMLYVCGWLQPFNDYNAAFSDEQLAELPENLAELI